MYMNNTIPSDIEYFETLNLKDKFEFLCYQVWLRKIKASRILFSKLSKNQKTKYFDFIKDFGSIYHESTFYCKYKESDFI